jgi:hypothetical protein
MTNRQVGNVSNKMPPTLPPHGPMELDSHADTCCAGSNCAIIEYTSKLCNVIGFNRDNPNAEVLNVPIIKAGTAYDAPWGETYIIVIPQALYLGDHLSYSLLCPNQLRHHGIIVNDVLVHLSPNPTEASHSIYIPEDELRIPLQLKGVISYFDTRRPSTQELEECKWVTITSHMNLKKTKGHSKTRNHT